MCAARDFIRKGSIDQFQNYVIAIHQSRAETSLLAENVGSLCTNVGGEEGTSQDELQEGLKGLAVAS